MKNRHFRKIDKFLELPKEVCSNEAKLTVIGFDEIIIENFQSILDYEEFFIRIKFTVNENGEISKWYSNIKWIWL